MSWFVILLALLFVLLCLVLILIILLQPGQSEGLAGAFGSGGMLGSAFGVHVKNRLAKLTTIMVILFFLIIFGFNMMTRSEREKSIEEKLEGRGTQTEEPAFVPAPGDEEGEEQKEVVDEEAAPAVQPPSTTEAPPAVPEKEKQPDAAPAE